MATVLDIIKQSLKALGVLAESEEPTASAAADALDALNNLLDQWKSESLMVYTPQRVTATLTASQTSFTVGTTGDIVTPRPEWIDNIAYVDNSLTNPVEFPLGLPLTDGEYAAITIKSLTAPRPTAAYYRPTFPLGTLIPWPIPTDSNLLWALYIPTQVAEFASTSTTLSLPPGYKRMIATNLAVELASSYEREPSPSLVRRAGNAMAAVKRRNYRPQLMGFGPEYLCGGVPTFDIRTGQ